MSAAPRRAAAFGLVLLALGGGLAAALGGPSAPAAAPSAWDACPAGAPLREHRVTALPVPVSYNHWGDFDPHGRILVPDEDREEALAQVAGNLRAAGLAGLAGAVEALQAALAGGDVVAAAAAVQREAAQAVAEWNANPEAKQPRDSVLERADAGARFDVSPLVRPYVARARLGECVVLRLLNALPEPVGLHVHAAAARPGQGMALGAQEPDLALPGQRRDVVVHLPDLPGMEGAHLVHSHADARHQTKHGLFGALVAEPADATWLAPDGSGATPGPDAIVARPGGSDFREHVVFYHDEAELFDHLLRPLPTVAKGGEYGPGSKAINLRAEPFMDRFGHVDALHADGLLPRPHDKSLAYSSYAYGDPGTFMPRAYVGDPTKFRVLNVGPAQHHVHHLHGGGVRWRAQPLAEDTQFDHGGMKHNPVNRSTSERVDVQNLGPGESFTAEIEGGAGGVQRAAGDFLVHCHVVEHYMAGMWLLWRVFDTRQEDLAELPDRAGRVPRAVTSLGLLGRAMPDGRVLDAASVRGWVEAQLPPRGVPDEGDAGAWDWALVETGRGPLYLGEPRGDRSWPNHQETAPGERPALRFNPLDGRLAYPFLTPHLGKRPPFAPAHGPAPHLGEEVDAARPDGLCPPSARRLSYSLVALQAPVRLHEDHVDPRGQVFVHAHDKDDVLAGRKEAKSLVVRANQGDCVDVLLTSLLAETPASPSKVNVHTHLVQFDVQASDGVIAGYHYEQSVRPASTTGGALLAPAAQGDAAVRMENAGRLRPGAHVGVGLTEPHAEVRRVVAVDGDVVRLDGPLARAHAAGERAGPEFVRYRWYADVELGTVYWHDHVDGLHSWRHGLFGTLVVEPAGSQWCDPKRPPANLTSCGGAWTLLEGHVADVVAADAPLDPTRTFREIVLQFQDRACSHATLCSPGRQFPVPPNRAFEPATFNLRSEPLGRRDLAHPFASWAGGQGDPATDALEAYAGDPVVARLVYAGQSMTRGVGTFAVTGHRFRAEPFDPASPVVDALSFGISGQHNLHLECGAGGCGGLAGDHLYHVTQPEALDRGAWGLLRVHDAPRADLAPLPGRATPAAPAPLPEGPVRRYDVVALQATVTLNARAGLAAPLKIFALASEEAAIRAGTLRPSPLVLRALPGEVVEVSLTNRLAEPVSLHAGLLRPLAASDVGMAIGTGPGGLVAPGATGTYRWHADAGDGVVRLDSRARHLGAFGVPVSQASEGLHGALVVEPAGSAFSPATGPHADLVLADGRRVREHVLLYASTDGQFASSTMPYLPMPQGLTYVNYRTEPLAGRVGPGDVHHCQVDARFTDCGFDLLRAEARSPVHALAFRDPPETPLLDARQGEGLVLRVVGAAGDPLQVHAVDGHWWNATRALVSAQTVGTGEAFDHWIWTVGAGGPGDYLWGTHRDPFLEAGAWGVLRVRGAQP